MIQADRHGMAGIIDESLKKIGKGSITVFLATAAGMLMAFIGRLIVARYVTQSEYGIFSLALAISTIFVLISTLGLEEGAARQIAYYRGKGDFQRVRGTVVSSIELTSACGILLALLLFFSADIISTGIFKAPKLSLPLKVFSITVPFFALIHVFASLFRGFDRTDARAYFRELSRHGLFLLLLIPIIFLRLPSISIFYAYLLSMGATFVATAIYTYKRLPVPITAGRENIPMRKELLFFSLPLLSLTIFAQIINWADTLMLGYFKTEEVVGLYSAAQTLTEMVLLFTSSMAFIYVPIASQFFARKLMREIERIYQVLTKWVFYVTFPVFMVLFLFPRQVLSLFYGERYAGAATVLPLLTIGVFSFVFLGSSGHTLIVLGKTKPLMWIVVTSAALKIALNIILIPPLGIVGAAIASAATYWTASIIASVRLYQVFRIHHFTSSYLRLTASSLLLSGIVYAVSQRLALTAGLMLVLSGLFIVLYLLSLPLTRSLDREDIELLLAVEKKTGLDLGPVKKLIKRTIM